MQIRTPKRYRRSGRRRRLISWRRLLFWMVVPLLIFISVGLYQNPDLWQDDAQQYIENLVGDASDLVSEGGNGRSTPTPDPTGTLMAADEAWSRGAIQDAMSLYQEIVMVTPNDVLVHYRLALGYIMEGKLEEALVAADNAVTAWPYSPDAWSIRAMALNRLGRSGKAIASAQRALMLVPETRVEAEPVMAVSRARALAFLAEAYLDTGQADRAFNTVKPKSPPCLLIRSSSSTPRSTSERFCKTVILTITGKIWQRKGSSVTDAQTKETLSLNFSSALTNLWATRNIPIEPSTPTTRP